MGPGMFDDLPRMMGCLAALLLLLGMVLGGVVVGVVWLFAGR